MYIDVEKSNYKNDVLYYNILKHIS